MAELSQADLQRKVAELEDDLANMEAERRRERRKLAHVQGELSKFVEGVVRVPEVEEVWDHYLTHLWGGRGRKPELDDSRTTMIRARLRYRGKEACFHAIEGIATFPFVKGKEGRNRSQGVRYSTPEHVFRDAKTFENALKLYDRAQCEELDERDAVDEFDHEKRMLGHREKMVMKLGLYNEAVTLDRDDGRMYADCPICGMGMWLSHGRIHCYGLCPPDLIDRRLHACASGAFTRHGLKIVPKGHEAPQSDLEAGQAA